MYYFPSLTKAQLTDLRNRVAAGDITAQQQINRARTFISSADYAVWLQTHKGTTSDLKTVIGGGTTTGGTGGTLGPPPTTPGGTIDPIGGTGGTYGGSGGATGSGKFTPKEAMAGYRSQSWARGGATAKNPDTRIKA